MCTIWQGLVLLRAFDGACKRALQGTYSALLSAGGSPIHNIVPLGVMLRYNTWPHVVCMSAVLLERSLRAHADPKSATQETLDAMAEAQAALDASTQSLAEAEPKQRALPAVHTHSLAPRQDMMQQRQPLSPHMQQQQPLSLHMGNSVQPGHVARAAQFLQTRSPASLQSQPAQAFAPGSHPAQVNFRMGGPGFQPQPQPQPQPHQLPPVTQQRVQPSTGQSASEWRSVADAPQRQVSFEGLAQRQPQPGLPATTSSASGGPASGPRVARSLSGPEAYWPPGEHAGPMPRQQLSRSSASSVASQGAHGFGVVGGAATQAMASGSGHSFNGPSGIAGGSPMSQQRHPAAAEFAPDGSVPTSPIIGDEGSLLGMPRQSRCNICIPALLQSRVVCDRL